MRSINYFYSVCLILISCISGISQTDYVQLIDTSELSKAELINLDELNTEYLEFSPCFYRSGIVYVSSLPQNKKAKIDNNIGESFFTLKFAELTDSGSLVQNIDFLADLKINNHAGPCSFSKDNSYLFLSRNVKNPLIRENEKKDLSPVGIFIYKNENGFWVADSEFPVNSYGYKVFHPAWDESNKRLIFASDMPGGFGGTDLYSLIKTDNGWEDLKNLGPEINTSSNESFPFIYDSKYLFFASNNPGGNGGLDIYFSPEVSSQFQKPVNLGTRFNTEYDDFGLIISDNAKRCFFTSSRPGGKGKDDIYLMRSEKSVFRVLNNYFTLTTFNKKSGTPVDNVKITFAKYELSKNENPRISKFRGIDKEIIYSIDSSSLLESKPIYSDNDGNYHLKLADGSYIIKALKTGYQPYSAVFNTAKNDKLIKIGLSNEILDTFLFSFINSENHEIIQDVNFDISDGNAVEIGKSNDNIYFISLPRGNSIKLKTTQEEFASKEILIDKLSTPGFFDIMLEKKIRYVEKLPTNIGESFILKDIYYDYNSSMLNRKAKAELDLLSNHLMQHTELKIELSSHTDSRGNNDYNQKLSEKRSMTAKNYLVGNGIKKERILAMGYGETNLKNECKDNIQCTESQHAENRRTEVTVIKK